MPVETDADRAALFDADEFSEAATWSLVDQWQPLPVVLHMETPVFGADLGSVEVTGQVFRARVRRSDLPDGAGRGDRIVITATGENYKVIRPFEFDDTRQVATVWLQPLEDAP